MKGTVFGLQRSGTNFTESLLKEHFQINIANTDRHYIWKHSHDFDLSKINDNHFHVYIVKYPYSWIESIRRKKVDILKRHPHLKADHSTEIVISEEIDLFKLAKLYNDHTLWWYSGAIVEKTKYIRVKYEDLISSDQSLRNFLCDFKDKYNGVHCKIDIKSSNIKHPQKVSQSEQWSDERREMYLKMKLPTLNWKEIELINKSLSDEVFEKTGYNRIIDESELLNNHK